MNYQEFAEKSGLNYGINRVNDSAFVIFYDNERNKVFEISRELGTTTLFNLYDFRNANFLDQKLVIEFLSEENQDDWFRYHEKEKTIDIYGIKLTQSEAKALYKNLSKQLKKEV